MSFPRAFYDAVEAQFERAASNLGTQDRDIKVAGRRLRCRFASASLESIVMSALGHREVAVEGRADLTVCIWDSASSTTPAFELPTTAAESKPGAEVFGQAGPLAFSMCVSTRTLSVLDSETNTAYYWIPDGHRYPWSHRASPLKTILCWWFGRQGLQLAHAAAVARDRAGALLPGRSGSGKSTTGLLCMRDPTRLVSDDLCLLEVGEVARLHGVYRTARVATRDLCRFPWISAKRPHGPNADEKSLIEIAERQPRGDLSSADLRVILIPRVTHCRKTQISRSSATDALRALAPSTLFQFAGDAAMRGRALRDLAAVVRTTPTFHLDLGTDLDCVHETVAGMLSEAKA